MRKNFSLTPEERADARAALQVLRSAGWHGSNVLTDAARVASGRSGASKVCTVPEAVEGFVRDCMRRGLRRRSVEFYESKLGAFAGGFDGRDLDSFARVELRDWLEAMAVADSTREGHLRAVRALFRWAERQEPALCRMDPTRGLALRVEREAREVAILSPGDAAWVMEHAGGYRAALALMLFAGVRPSEVNAREKPPLLWRQLDFKAKTVRIEAATAKTRVARVLEDLPANLWQWLKLERGEHGEPVCPLQTRFLSRWLIGREGCPIADWKQDVCRHSFATYHVAAFSNVERTSLIMGHEGRARLLHQRYRGVATRAEAVAFFGIKPK